MVRFRWEADFKESEIGMFKTKGTAHYIFAHGVCGKIPKDWKVKRINEDYNVNTGERVSPTSEGPFPVYGANGFSGYSNNFLIDKEAIITGRVGTLGQVYRVNGKSNISDNALYITKKKEEAVIDFLYYALKLIFDNIEEVLNVGTTQPLIKQSEVQKFSIPFPEYKEQFYVASVLSWIEDLIENKKRQNEILEEVAMAIFKNWFVDFEPFKDGEFVPSELGEIPKGWEVTEFGKIVKFLYGEGLPERKREEGPYPVVGSSGIIGYHSRYLAPAPSIVLGRKGNVGSMYLMLEPSFPIDTVFYTSPKTPSEFVFYAYHYLKNTSLEEMASSHTAVPGLDIHTLNSLKLISPPKPIIQKFQSFVESLFQKILLNQKEIMVLRKFRDFLLPLLVFGKLRVEEI
ncbi:MAG: restriction endonuclease subunit S [Candidatus Bathyarchaeia archaeon]